MNVAIIIAGGTGMRMNSEIPKQFIKVDNKPIIVYTMEAFERHEQIDAIEVVILDGYVDYIWELAKQYNISKLRWVVQGGENGQGSARNGVLNLKNELDGDDIVIIHDAIRPIVPKVIIDDLIRVAKLYGNACSSLPTQETLIQSDNNQYGNVSLERSTVRRIQTPQAYKFGKIAWAHEEALRRGITNSVYANTMMIELGETIYFSLGFINNVKITTPEDIALFKALKDFPEKDLVSQ